MKNLTFNGLKVKVFKTKVKIYDPEDRVSDDEALHILSYLSEEGLLDNMELVECEIISN